MPEIFINGALTISDKLQGSTAYVKHRQIKVDMRIKDENHGCSFDRFNTTHVFK